VLAADAVAGCNLVHERSGTGARIRIVGYYQCAQANYQRTVKGRLREWMAATIPASPTSWMVGNAKGADLVTFICVSTEDGAAAVAQQPGRYSAFDPGSFWAAVVAHELGGHNYGCEQCGERSRAEFRECDHGE
jgi:hypothetical protein